MFGSITAVIVTKFLTRSKCGLLILRQNAIVTAKDITICAVRPLPPGMIDVYTSLHVASSDCRAGDERQVVG